MAEQVEPGYIIIDSDEQAVENKMDSLEHLGLDYTVTATRTGTGMQGKPTYRWTITWSSTPDRTVPDAQAASGLGSGPR